MYWQSIKRNVRGVTGSLHPVINLYHITLAAASKQWVVKLKRPLNHRVKRVSIFYKIGLLTKHLNQVLESLQLSVKSFERWVMIQLTWARPASVLLEVKLNGRQENIVQRTHVYTGGHLWGRAGLIVVFALLSVVPAESEILTAFHFNVYLKTNMKQTVNQMLELQRNLAG